MFPSSFPPQQKARVFGLDMLFYNIFNRNLREPCLKQELWQKTQPVGTAGNGISLFFGLQKPFFAYYEG